VFVVAVKDIVDRAGSYGARAVIAASCARPIWASK
jgi:hypothetical protein